MLVSDALLLSDVEVDPNSEMGESVDAFVSSEVIVDTNVVKLIAAEEAVVIDVGLVIEAKSRSITPRN